MDFFREVGGREKSKTLPLSKCRSITKVKDGILIISSLSSIRQASIRGYRDARDMTVEESVI